MLKCLKVFVSNLWLCQPFPGTFGSSLAFRKAAAMLATVLVWSDQYRRLQKKVDIKKMCFFSVKWNSLFDFVTSFLWFCVPSQGPSGPPRPPEKRQQPRMYIKLSGQTSTKDLRSILLLHEFDSKKIFTIIKIIGRPLNLLFLTFDFFSLRASN